MPLANQGTSEYDINQLNLAMRQTDWYQDYFRARGLNPNQVKLSDGQRRELEQLAQQNGYELGDRMKIDQAGNINQKGGFAGMPTWAKAAIAAAAVVGTGGALGAAGIGPMAGMMGGGGGGAAAGGATSAAIPTIGSTSLTTGMAGAAPSLAGLSTINGVVGATGATGAAKAGGGLISRLMGSDTTQNFADAGKLLQSFGNDEANNRLTNAGLRSNFENSRANLTQNYDQLQLGAAANRRTDESDALKKLSQTSYIRSGGAPFDASKVQLSGGRSLPSFNFPRAPISDEMKSGAGDLEATLLARLKNGSYTPTDLQSYLPSNPESNGAMNRGVGEQIGRWGSLATTGLGFFNNLYGRN